MNRALLALVASHLQNDLRVDGGVVLSACEDAVRQFVADFTVGLSNVDTMSAGSMRRSVERWIEDGTTE